MELQGRRFVKIPRVCAASPLYKRQRDTMYVDMMKRWIRMESDVVPDHGGSEPAATMLDHHST
jgi:hypothetical protein